MASTSASATATATAPTLTAPPTTPPVLVPTSPSRAIAHVNPPPMDYFAGIQRTSYKQEQPSSTTHTPQGRGHTSHIPSPNNVIANNNKYSSLSDRSVTSSLTNDSMGDMDFHSVSSSIMSVEEREWQRVRRRGPARRRRSGRCCQFRRHRRATSGRR